MMFYFDQLDSKSRRGYISVQYFSAFGHIRRIFLCPPYFTEKRVCVSAFSHPADVDSVQQFAGPKYFFFCDHLYWYWVILGILAGIKVGFVSRREYFSENTLCPWVVQSSFYRYCSGCKSNMTCMIFKECGNRYGGVACLILGPNFVSVYSLVSPALMRNLVSRFDH